MIADEAAFWYSDDFSANADTEILNACRPGLATTGGPLLIASSPYAKRGELWETHRKHYGAGGDPLILVVQGSSREFNPSLPQSVVDRALARDHAAASAEYLAQFRSDLESFVNRECVLSCVDAGVLERPSIAGLRYQTFIDPSGGSSDSMTCAIGHEVDGRVILDCLREVPAPFDPESVVDEFVQLLARYGVRETNGDRYAAAWVATAFEKRGVSYRHCELPRSALYLNLLPHLNAKTVRLLDNQRLVNQISSLERRTARGARDTVDHPRGQHDDAANSIAGLVYVLAQRPKQVDWYLGSGWGGKPTSFTELFAADANPNPQSPPCTIPLQEPSDETVRRWAAHAAYLQRKADEERAHRSKFAIFR